jgi:TRAP transporter TAXI family solute receptor
MRRVISVTALAAAVAALLTGAVIAQQADRGQKLAPFGSDPDIQILAQARRSRSVSSRPDPDGNLPDRDALNNGTVTVITAPVGGAFAAMGSDMANVLDDGENLRVLPIIGKGSVQNLIDIMRLRNVDMGFVVSDAVEFVKTEYHVPNMEDRVRYIAKLFNNDLHIVARKDIKTIRDLAGRKIFSERNLGYFALRNVFNRLKITADIDFRTDDAGGLQKMLAGEADAWIVSAGKIAPIIRNIKNESGLFHLVPVPYEPSLEDIYVPSTITSEEYPNLLAQGEKIETVASSTLLMVYNWPEGTDRYERVARFVNGLFSKIDELRQPPRHPKWRETSLSAKILGLQRFKAADDWLAAHAIQSAAGTTLSPPDREKLFNDFLQWQRTTR